MKKILFAMGVICAIAITSCKDDFKVAAPYRNITIAYALLNRSDTAHYFRIQKAFLDENKSAITMAQNPDSSFYKESDLTVEFKEYEEKTEKLRRTFTLSRVDLNLEGYPKEQAGNQGFFTSPNYAYKLKMAAGDSLNADLKYRLVIRNSATGETDSSDFVSPVNSAYQKGVANSFYVPNFENAAYLLGFANTSPAATFTLSGNTPKNGKLVEGVIRFYMVEQDNVTLAKKRLQADYAYNSKDFEPQTQFRLVTQNSGFYSFLIDNFGAAPANTSRFIDSVDMYVYCGSNEIFTYQQINIVQTGGLLGDQIKPTYTNMRGANVFGLIGTRATRSYKNIPIDNNTVDSIKVHPLTRSLNIKGRSED